MNLNVMNWRCFRCFKFLNMSTYCLIFKQELIKSIMMLMLRLQNQWNNIHIEWTPWNLQYLREEIQYLLDHDLNLVKVIGVLLAVLCQNRVEHFICTLTIEKWILWLKQTYFQCLEWMTALTTLVHKICDKIGSFKRILANFTHRQI